MNEQWREVPPADAAGLTELNGAIQTRRGFTVWLTGLPGAGKTTLARLLETDLTRRGLPVETLDGDEMRRHLSKDLRFTREDRDENVRRLAYIANLLCHVGGVAIVAAVSPYAAGRNEARAQIGRFVEVFVRCPLAICMQRDPKGLYAKAFRSEAFQVTGITDPYEEPLHPDVIVDTDQESPKKSLEKIVRQLQAVTFI